MPSDKKNTIGPSEDKIDFERLADLYKDKRLNARFEELGRFYKGSKRKLLYNDLPDVPRPSMFLPDPFVVGSPREAVLAKRIVDTDPYAKANIRDITFGPTRDSMGQMVKSKLPIDRFGGTTLLGVTNRLSGMQQVGVNPASSIGDVEPDYDSADTLAHEISHRGGAGESRAEEAGRMLGNIFKYYSLGRDFSKRAK